MSSLTSRIALFAQALNALLADEDTPAMLRRCVKHCISELRDALPPAEALRVDGMEAEAVVISFAALEPDGLVHLQDEGSPLLSLEKPCGPRAIS